MTDYGHDLQFGVAAGRAVQSVDDVKLGHSMLGYASRVVKLYQCRTPQARRQVAANWFYIRRSAPTPASGFEISHYPWWRSLG